jgi:hypothetical protein
VAGVNKARVHEYVREIQKPDPAAEAKEWQTDFSRFEIRERLASRA